MFAISLLAVIQLTPGAPVPKDFKTIDYFPAVVGTRWVYELKTGAKHTEEVVELESRDGFEVVTIRNYFDTNIKLDIVYEKSITAVATRHTLKDMFTVPVLWLPLKEGNTVTTKIAKQTELFGDSVMIRVGKKEKITVPAGTFEAIRVRTVTTYDNNRRVPYQVTSSSWYVSGVGVVKVEYSGGYRVLKEFIPGTGIKPKPKK